ncbi:MULTISPECIES: family 20 glycosylhydrolase [Colwelliaceae]|uniref:beta-N-acetylhexosaminidase n=1 Tax=Colwellia psychrerythraea TaxID=28229 RepID=A0A099KE29_COLPS|nr:MULTISPECIES: family 20 glycosylhydrolase [Colwelliaceae]KGJ88282.1 Beta-N-acetylhexosaminidase [Colwellia psychrerythraea]KGJ95061.1 Beta-N-acetylhexosaminidase [Thalassotalea sp. ND16A]
MNKKTPCTLLATLPLAFSLGLTLSGCEQLGNRVDNASATTAPIVLHHASQQDINEIAATLEVKYRVISNVATDKCNATLAEGACFEAELSLTAKTAIAANNWAIQFSSIMPVQSSNSNEFTIAHINGSVQKISLSENFSGFKAGETKRIAFRASHWMLSEHDALPNYLVTAPSLQARVITSTQTTIDPETNLEVIPFIEPFTDERKQFKRNADDKTAWLTSESLYQRNLEGAANSVPSTKLIASAIIPTPKSLHVDPLHARVDISKGLYIDFTNVAKKDVNAAIARLATLGVKQGKEGFPLTLNINADTTKPLGSYQLLVGKKSISIVGVDSNGVFNGLQSLASLYTVGQHTLPVVTVSDEPHYAFRGMLVDVARNFHSKEFILSLLEQMAAYKLNKLHLHLGDDEGWRLEIPSLPELTDIASKRCFDEQEQTCLSSQLGAGVDTNSPVNGYYSVSDYQEILQAATARHIQVIPSLDMPGHSRAAVKAMNARYNKYQALGDEAKAQQYLLDDFNDKTQYSSVQFYDDNTINVCLESSYDFVLEVMTQVKKIHSDAGQPLTRYHIGADETAGAWLESPVCKDFIASNEVGVTKMSELGAYFIERVAGILTSLDIETAGWSDGLSHTRNENMPDFVQANAWDVLSWNGHEKVHEVVNRGWQVVVSSPDALYFDLPYEASPKEHGFYWASRHVNTEKIFQFMPDNLPAHAEIWVDQQETTYIADDTKTARSKGKPFLGIQGQLWSETTRSDEIAEHKVFPRLLALAERAWHLPEWALPYNYQGAVYSQDTHYFTEAMAKTRDQKWRLFSTTLGQKEFAKLELADVDYRLPTVGAVVEQGMLIANIAFSGLGIEYQLVDASGAVQAWQVYTKPVNVSAAQVNVRSRSVNGARAGRTTNIVVH